MSQHKRADVRIKNPAGGRGYTSRKRAERYIRDGRARWTSGDTCIEFLEQHYSHTTVVAHVKALEEYDIASSTGQATLRQLANLPMVAPAVFLGFGKRKGASRSSFTMIQGF